MVTRRIVRNVLFAALVTSPIAADEFRVGVATVDITPPIPYRMSGYFSERLSTGVKDPLQAKAVVFSQGDTKAALVFCDLIGISPDVARRTRSVASRATHIPSDNIAICATHSHTGPLYWGALREFMHKRAVKRHGTDKYETVDYGSQLVYAGRIDQTGPLSGRVGSSASRLCERKPISVQSSISHAGRDSSFQSRPTES